MALILAVALFNGALNIFNKLVNVRAKQCLGMVNGTLVNYLEGALIGLLLSLLLGQRQLLDWGTFVRIPPVLYLGGVFGLLAMVLTIRGMESVPVGISAVVILAGQLLAGFAMDLAAGKVGLRAFLGLCLVGVGVLLNNRMSRGDAGEPEEAPERPA